MVSGKSKLNPFVKLAIDSGKATAPDFFKDCPWSGAKDATFSNNFLAFFPTGQFRIKVTSNDGSKDLLKFVLDFVMS
jgi:hypothetical protein